MAEDKNIPHFVSLDTGAMIVGKEYASWLAKVKRMYRSSQAKAVSSVNAEMLQFNWELGSEIVRMQGLYGWGNGVVKQLSLDLRSEYPAVNGFAVRNLEYMKRWYSFYCERLAKSHQPSAFFGDMKSHQPGAIIPMPEHFALIPWRHHVEIVYRCETIEEALYYLQKTSEGNWNRDTLIDYIKSDLYRHTGNAITNYDEHLPAEQSDVAKSMLKDPYHFEFLDLRPKYTERELEDALMQNITRFLLELGHGFAFVGRQMELRMPDGKSFFPDLVFYHFRQKRFVVLELKIDEFIPEYAGKINFYVNAADKLLKGDDDNASVGLLICRNADKAVVEWSFQGMTNPIGVATYELEEVVNRTIKALDRESKA